MREQFVIEGNHSLRGEVTVSGNKNAALKMLPACLLTDEPVTLTNVPDIADVRVTLELLRRLGCEVGELGDHRVRVHARDIAKHELDREMCVRTRASIVFGGSYLTANGPGGSPTPCRRAAGRR